MASTVVGSQRDETPHPSDEDFFHLSRNVFIRRLNPDSESNVPAPVRDPRFRVEKITTVSNRKAKSPRSPPAYPVPPTRNLGRMTDMDTLWNECLLGKMLT
jgi:hypothetical protein